VSTRQHYIEVRGLPIEVVRKDIKNLHVGVYPPQGHVRVAAPLRIGDEAVRLAIISRLSWIRRQQAHFTDQERQSQREFVNGESLFFRGVVTG
jgi:predicted metal-dependent hydrolase